MIQPPNRKKKRTKSNNRTSSGKPKISARRKILWSIPWMNPTKWTGCLTLLRTRMPQISRFGSHQTKNPVHLMMSRATSSHHITHTKPTREKN
ncbi:hypothetical protein Pst134EB_023389 [Puccinia striiformis f. sp. tritici]|nr:hypothetical protein Pst134EB_023389 [Puccinia striiformis f. sp. tritici]